MYSSDLKPLLLFLLFLLFLFVFVGCCDGGASFGGVFIFCYCCERMMMFFFVCERSGKKKWVLTTLKLLLIQI